MNKCYVSIKLSFELDHDGQEVKCEPLTNGVEKAQDYEPAALRILAYFDDDHGRGSVFKRAHEFCKANDIQVEGEAGELEVTIMFEEIEAQHVCSNAHCMRMSVAQYLACTIFNGCGCTPSIIEVTDDDNKYNSRWESNE